MHKMFSAGTITAFNQPTFCLCTVPLPFPCVRRMFCGGGTL